MDYMVFFFLIMTGNGNEHEDPFSLERIIFLRGVATLSGEATVYFPPLNKGVNFFFSL